MTETLEYVYDASRYWAQHSPEAMPEIRSRLDKGIARGVAHLRETTGRPWTIESAEVRQVDDLSFAGQRWDHSLTSFVIIAKAVAP